MWHANSRFWFGDPRGKVSLGILWRRWEDNVKTDLREMEWGRWRALD